MGDRDARVLRGERVVLRRATAADAPALLALLRHPEVSDWWPPDEDLARSIAGEWGEVVFAIEVDGEVAGIVQYGEENDPEYRHASVDIALGAAWHGRGLGAEALRVLARHLFEDRGHHRLTIDPAAENERAIRCYSSVGFKPVGVVREAERRGERWRDALLMDLLARELR